ncbi:carboxymuconolactone decarboxylase family protein [Leisingera sp. ANG-M7]|uniref:carboxymuconolactone decarboxylase family protein n=1 Tax=Leisingera sp. ANG-M7 TaxID=1577902 RepID=UPI00057E523E|nr:carboxymuconolactone decarboxylase [Leisingera sp. ANG-M7]KIC35832.1 carboxymuconolactone decarboxylase [Leisingera sp. ANG-M7]
MTNFTMHDETTAPEASRELLENAKKAYGAIPGLYAVMAEAPELLKSYHAVHAQFVDSGFTAEELTVVWQAINVENGCGYCVPAHTAIAKSMNVDDAIGNALRDGTPLPNARLEALRDFTLTMVRDRGHVSEQDMQAFLAAGFSTRNMLGVILGYAQKVMSNYTNHLAHTPVDKMFQPFAWQPAQAAE